MLGKKIRVQSKARYQNGHCEYANVNMSLLSHWRVQSYSCRPGIQYIQPPEPCMYAKAQPPLAKKPSIKANQARPDRKTPDFVMRTRSAKQETRDTSVYALALRPLRLTEEAPAETGVRLPRFADEADAGVAVVFLFLLPGVLVSSSAAPMD